jgi:hypothetical protein
MGKVAELVLKREKERRKRIGWERSIEGRRREGGKGLAGKGRGKEEKDWLGKVEERREGKEENYWLGKVEGRRREGGKEVIKEGSRKIVPGVIICQGVFSNYYITVLGIVC